MSDIITTIYQREYWWLWALIFGFALFFPVRKLIWVLMVRRAIGALKIKDKDISDTEIARLKRRAGVTAILISYITAILFVWANFTGVPAQ